MYLIHVTRYLNDLVNNFNSTSLFPNVDINPLHKFPYHNKILFNTSLNKKHQMRNFNFYMTL